MGEFPQVPAERFLLEADAALDEDDPLNDKLLGIHAALVAWRANDISTVPDTMLPTETRADRNDIQRWLFAELSGLFTEIRNAARRCRLTIGGSEAKGHRLAPLADGYALFESETIAPGESLNLDYANKHTVPQDAGFDQIPGLMDSEQLYIGDTARGVAISLNQLALTLLADGRISLL